jgi:Na+/H+ antiporter NhaA
MPKKAPVDALVEPIKRFINNSTTSGILLFSSATLALILSNSPWQDEFHHFWENHFGFGFNDFYLDKTLHHWINDGLMAVFFFVVGLELKREIIAGELNEPRKAILPIACAIGGMLFPALIYLLFNHSDYSAKGWGIPMATASPLRSVCFTFWAIKYRSPSKYSSPPSPLPMTMVPCSLSPSFIPPTLTSFRFSRVPFSWPL